MEAESGRPFLLLDIDDPAQPLRGQASAAPARLPRAPAAATQSRGTAGGPRTAAQPLRVRRNAAHGATLLGLGYELVWATAWAAEANEYIAPCRDCHGCP
ncbi:hypothetical protein [Streptomyces axinellae]|uniref:Uncharacterized protein n=1 Tax=Streptomyces axinellae TaxID=552788 RepID=A0ABP6CVD3_9ACTN